MVSQFQKSQNRMSNLGKSPEAIVIVIAFVLLANVFATIFISHEHYLYEWDTLNYWKKFVNLKAHFLTAPRETLKVVFYSVREDNYNDLAAFILVPFGLLFGTSRLAYILSIVNIFAVP